MLNAQKMKRSVMMVSFAVLGVLMMALTTTAAPPAAKIASAAASPGAVALWYALAHNLMRAVALRAVAIQMAACSG